MSKRKAVSGTILMLLLISMPTLTYSVQQSVEPSPRIVGVSFMSPPPNQWNKTYEGTSHARLYSGIQTNDGGYTLVGDIIDAGGIWMDVWMLRTDSLGGQEWNKTYGTPGVPDQCDESRGGKKIVQTSDEGYAIAVLTRSFGAGYYDYWLVKTDAFGNMQWSKTYGGKSDDYVSSIIQTNDAGYAMIGYTNSFGAGGSDMWLIKTDLSGNAQWNKTYGGTYDDRGESVVQTSDGGYAIAGVTASFGAGSNDFWLVKTDSNGTMQWSQTFGGTNSDMAESIVQTSDEGYTIGGMTASFGNNYWDFWLVSTYMNGTQEWARTYGGTDSDFASFMIQTGDGGYAMIGTSSFGTGNNDFWLVRTDDVGNQLWNKTCDGASADSGSDVIQTMDGGYAMVGWTVSVQGHEVGWLIKTDVESPSIAHVSRTPATPAYDSEVIVTATIKGNVVDKALLSYTCVAMWHNATMNKFDDVFNSTIPAQPYGTLVQYRIYANDTSSHWATSRLYSYTVGDFVAPEVDLERIPDYPMSTQTVKVLANVTEPVNASGVQTVLFSYRVNGQQWWNTTMVFNPTLGLYESTIPTQQTKDLIEYLVKATDNAGNIHTTAILSYVAAVPGDVNHDHVVDVFDILKLKYHRSGPPPGPGGYDPNVDINGDRTIDVFDILIAKAHLGQSW